MKELTATIRLMQNSSIELRTPVSGNSKISEKKANT